MRATWVLIVVLAVMPVAETLWAQNQTPGAAREEYLPLEELPAEAELPAAPMVIAAYSFVWAAFLVYALSIVRRIKRVEADLRALEQTRR